MRPMPVRIAGNALQGFLVNVSDINQVSARSFVDQVPAGSGIANQLQINFGPAQLPDLDAFGTYTAPDTAQYAFQINLSFQRTTAGGEAHLWGSIERNGTQIGSTFLVVLDTQRQRENLSVTVFQNLDEDDEIKFFFYRGDVGLQMNDGFLSAVANPDGLIAAASAFLEVTQLRIGGGP